MAEESFQREFLESHNAYRKMHGAPPLTISRDLNDSAQKWADHLLSLGLMSHSDTKNGENIYSKLSSDALKGKDAVDSWYSEVTDYNWSNPGFSGKTGHFTQVVWKESTKLGVGVATAGTRSYVVAQYSPPGNMNMPGQFEENVLQKGPKDACIHLMDCQKREGRRHIMSLFGFREECCTTGFFKDRWFRSCNGAERGDGPSPSGGSEKHKKSKCTLL